MSRSDVQSLERKVRWLKLYVLSATLVLGVLALAALGPAGGSERFEKIEAERIDIVGADGSRSVVLSNRERFPNPVVGGEEFERSIAPAGLVLYGADGNEMGGMGAVDVEGRARQTLLIFDYQNSEAIGYSAGETGDGEQYKASLTIADRVPLDADIREVGTTGTSRIDIQNENGNASILVNDPDGNPRIRLYVNAEGESGIQMLNRSGEVISRLRPREGNR